MDPLVKLKIAALGAIIESLLDDGSGWKDMEGRITIPFEELERAPSVTVDADPSSKTLIVQLVEEEDD